MALLQAIYSEAFWFVFHIYIVRAPNMFRTRSERLRNNPPLQSPATIASGRGKRKNP